MTEKLHIGLILLLLNGLSYANLLPNQGQIFAVLGLLAAIAYFIANGINDRPPYNFLKLVIGYFSYICIALVSILFVTFNKPFGFSFLQTYTISLLVSLYFAIYFSRQPPDAVLKLLVLNGWVAFFLVAWFFTEYGILLRSTGDRVLDANINTLALSLVLGLTAELLRFTNMEGKQINPSAILWNVGTLAAFLVAMAATYSRGGLLFSVFILSMFFFRMLRFAKGVRAALPIAVLFACMLIAAFQMEEIQVISEWYTYLTERVGQRTDEGELRRFALDYGLSSFADNPIFGIGYSNFPDAFQGATGHEAIPPHNDFLEAFVELGLIGGGAYLAIVIFVFRNWILLAKRESYKPLLLVFLLLVAYSFVRPMQTMVIWHLFFFYSVLARAKKKYVSKIS